MGVLERKRQKRIREDVIERDGLLCCYCNKKLTLETITMEHIVPDSKKGTFNTTNLTVSCSTCNNRRGNKPFFDYCKQFNWSDEKLDKYKKLYFNNLKIKVLNIAKEKCMKDDWVVPISIIKKSCQILKIKRMDFSDYERICHFEIKFDEPCDRKKIKYCFEQLIKIIEAESGDISMKKENIMSLQPLRDFVVVSVPKATEEKVGLIYKPATVDEKVVTGTVVATGSGHLTNGGSIVPLEVKAGDSILFNKQMSVEVKNNGETFYLLREEHVLSVVR